MLFTRGEVSGIDVPLTYKYVINHLTSRVSLLPDKVRNIKVSADSAYGSSTPVLSRA